MEVDDFDARTATFSSWLKEMGIQTNPKMALADFRAEGRGRGVGMIHSFFALLSLVRQLLDQRAAFFYLVHPLRIIYVEDFSLTRSSGHR